MNTSMAIDPRQNVDFHVHNQASVSQQIMDRFDFWLNGQTGKDI